MNVTGYKKWVILALMLVGLLKMLSYHFKPYLEEPSDPHAAIIAEELRNAPAKFCKRDMDCDPVPRSCRRCHCPDEKTLKDLQRDPVVCQLTSDQHMYCDVVCKTEVKCVSGRCEGKSR